MNEPTRSAHEVAADPEARRRLLGWTPAAPDARDYRMGDALDRLQRAPVPDASLADKTIRQAYQEGYFSSWPAMLAFWAWLKEEFGGTPPPNPDPAPAQAVRWADPDQLNQGETNHCVGFGCTQFLNASPVNDHRTNADANALYYACKVIDGQPREENGSSVHSGAKALKNLGRINAYVWGSSLDEIERWVLGRGPVIVGTRWTNDMFTPDAGGFVHPTGPVEGGHCYLMIGYDSGARVFTFQNSWGADWGDGGYFRMSANDWSTLFQSGNAEACAAVELPLPAAG
jgi:hypothetical protein